MATWEHNDIIIGGKSVKAQAPIIVSASRSTDIPAPPPPTGHDCRGRGKAWKSKVAEKGSCHKAAIKNLSVILSSVSI